MAFNFKRREVKIEDIADANKASLKHIYVLLKRIADTSKRTEKEQIIKENQDVPNFKDVVMYALDPFKMFHLTSIISSKGLGTVAKVQSLREPTIENIFKKLDELADARGATMDDRTELSWLASADEETKKVVNFILDKDLKCGAGVKTFRKFFPEIPNHEVALCDKDLEKFKTYCDNDPSLVLVSDKLDGVRTWAFVDKGEVRYLSRNGKDYTNFSCFGEEATVAINYISQILFCDPSRIILDGEAIGANRDFEAFVGNARKQEGAETADFEYHVFDFFCKDMPDMPLHQRLDILEAFFGQHGVHKLRMVKHSKLLHWEDVDRLLEDALQRGEEGLVLKSRKDPYTFGRSRSWCKVKKRETVDLPVLRVIEGEGKYEGVLGALVCEYNGTEVKVGSGYTDAQRIEYMTNPPKMVEVYFQNQTGKGSLRFPIFIRDRFDKEE